ncbi:unnamed protein product [Closterium sp. Yama58-4]|nr:unnamed protein product [Closterium sp. Yama58-4]
MNQSAASRGDSSTRAPSHRRTSSDYATGHGFDTAGQSAPRRALTRSASFQPIDGSDADSLSSGSPDAEDSFAFHVSVPGIRAAAASVASAAPAGAALPSRIFSTAETDGADARQLSSTGAPRSPSRSAAAAAAAAIAPAQTGASRRSGPQSPTPPTSQGFPRTPSLRLPPSPASSRRGIISPSSFHASACPLPPPSPSASPVSSPCLSPSSFAFAVPRANSRENRASSAASSSISRGGDGGSGFGQRGNLPRSMSSQWESSSRSLRAGRNLSVSSPNRMLSTNLNLKAAMACVAADSAAGAADSPTGSADSPRAGAAVSAAMPSPTRSATAGGILRRGGLKRMPSFDSMSRSYATSSSPSSSPLSIHTAANPPATAIPTKPLPKPATAGPAEAAAEATGSGAAAAAAPSPSLSPKGSPPTPQLSPGRSPKGKHVRRVSFCSMRGSQSFTERPHHHSFEAPQNVPPAAPHPMQRGSQSFTERPHHHSFEAPQNVPPAAPHPMQRGSQSFTERPRRHSRSPSYSGSLLLVPEPAAQPQGIRRSSSFQSLGSGASAGQHSSYGRPRHQLAYHPSHYPSNHTAHLPSNLSPKYHSSQSYSAAGQSFSREGKKEGRQSPELGDVGVGSGSGELELQLKIPVPPKMPSPRLSPSPRVQKLLQHMWGDLDDGDSA